MQSKAQIDQILRQKSDAKEIPGVVAMAAASGPSQEVDASGPVEGLKPVVLEALEHLGHVFGAPTGLAGDRIGDLGVEQHPVDVGLHRGNPGIGEVVGIKHTPLSLCHTTMSIA